MNQEKKWLRFSLRSLLVVPALIGCYLACGGPTKTQGVRDVVTYQRTHGLHDITPNYVAPMVLKCWVSTKSASSSTETTKTTYFVWFFGYVYHIPFDSVQTKPLDQLAPN